MVMTFGEIVMFLCCKFSTRLLMQDVRSVLTFSEEESELAMTVSWATLSQSLLNAKCPPENILVCPILLETR